MKSTNSYETKEPFQTPVNKRAGYWPIARGYVIYFPRT